MEREVAYYQQPTVNGVNLDIRIYRRDNDVLDRKGRQKYQLSYFWAATESMDRSVTVAEVFDLVVYGISEKKQVFLELRDERKFYISEQGIIFQDIEGKNRQELGVINLEDTQVELGEKVTLSYRKHRRHLLNRAGNAGETIQGVVKTIQFSEQQPYK